MTVERLNQVAIGTTERELPVFFPSVSSVKTNLSPTKYVELLVALIDMSPQFLISAFDVGRALPNEQEELGRLLVRAQQAGAVVLLDSGNYESYWKNAQSEWRQADFHEIIRQCPIPLAFGFDDQNPPADDVLHVQRVVHGWVCDQAVSTDTIVIPIVHASKPENLPPLCARIAKDTGAPMIAVPERLLGSGLFERVRTVEAIRTALDTTGRYTCLHLLGTGNPISLALYAMAGADSFDGLEWCQTVVDHETALLYHFSQADFHRQQTPWGDNDSLSFQAKTLAHNLEFYRNWMIRLRGAIHAGEGIDFCRYNFPKRIFLECKTEFGWEEE